MTKKKPAIVKRFDDYFGAGTLEDWQRLCGDVGLSEDFGSKTKCRKALKRVHVNIHDLLSAIENGHAVHRFRNVRELAEYSVREGKIYPKRWVKDGPIKALLRCIA
ncbi:hypothetical protein B0H67DRAFT_85409 [Lasiosphaeris hirsuta]|uniref:Uncharacterized protein n=1 Tax=Lasiosphaeris hirsuta TaxID=260670 RepID=A0AA40BCH5_9PEZI|nr:hypothetical protein B0H67DRAFT_85409 [Lasiosphaeris hirsuta]